MDEKEAEARPVMGTIFLVYIFAVLMAEKCMKTRYGHNTKGLQLKISMSSFFL